MTYSQWEYYVNDVLLPRPQKFQRQWSENWSADTGRDASGRMQGTSLGVKEKHYLEWNTISFSDMNTIRAAVSGNQFVRAVCTDLDGTIKEYEGYFGDLKETDYSWHPNVRYATNVSVNFIER